MIYHDSFFPPLFSQCLAQPDSTLCSYHTANVFHLTPFIRIFCHTYRQHITLLSRQLALINF